MLNTININLKTDIKNDRPTALGIKLMSQDKNNNQFILRFTNGGEPVNLDHTYTVEILTKFSNSGASRLTSATVRQDYATWEFDTAYITQDETVYNYVYVRKAGSLVVSADANAFYFDVGLSEIDKNAGRVAEVYDENYEKYLDEFKDNVDFEEIAQAEQARKEAELLREENYNQKVDTAIVEADVVAKVDNKVTELTPQISNLTAHLDRKANQIDIPSNIQDFKAIYIFDRMPDSATQFYVNDVIFTYANLLNWEVSSWEVGSITSSTGLLTPTATRIRTKDFIAVEANSKYKCLNLTAEYKGSGSMNIVEYDSSDAFIGTTGWFENGYVYTTSPTTKKIKVLMASRNQDDTVTINDPKNISKPVITRLY